MALEKWWSDRKLMLGFILVLLSIIIGVWGKVLLPFNILKGISLWGISWLILFLGIFLVGWETIKMIQSQIHQHVRKTVKGTYNYTKKTSRSIVKKIKNRNEKKSIDFGNE